MINRKYVAIDAKKLHDDVFKANTIMNDGISVSARLVDNGLSNSVLANAVHNFKKRHREH